MADTGRAALGRDAGRVPGDGFERDDWTGSMSETKPKLTPKQQVFVSEYLKCFNATAAAIAAGYSEKSARQTGCDLLASPNISVQIQARINEVHMSADEALKLQADLAHVDVGFFFKIVDEWMFYPLPSYEILDEREVIDETVDPPKKRVSYRVRHVALDMDKVQDPRYSWMIKSFSDSSKFGLKIETYDRQTAIANILKVHGRFTETVDLKNSDGSLKPIVNIYIPDNSRDKKE